MTILFSVMLGFLSAIFGFVAIVILLKYLNDRQKRYCEYCGEYKNNVILWIKDGFVHKICEDCLKEGALRDKKDK